MERDARLIFPFIRDAMALEPALELLASPWSPPAWMKTNSDMCHGGKLKEDCYGAFAEYLIRYLQACRDVYKRQLYTAADFPVRLCIL